MQIGGISQENRHKHHHAIYLPRQCRSSRHSACGCIGPDRPRRQSHPRMLPRYLDHGEDLCSSTFCELAFALKTDTALTTTQSKNVLNTVILAFLDSGVYIYKDPMVY